MKLKGIIEYATASGVRVGPVRVTATSTAGENNAMPGLVIFPLYSW